jgi:hypothetical protein
MLKNLDAWNTELKAGPNVEARAGTFIQEYSDSILQCAGDETALRALVKSVVEKKAAFAKTISHTG